MKEEQVILIVIVLLLWVTYTKRGCASRPRRQLYDQPPTDQVGGFLGAPYGQTIEGLETPSQHHPKEAELLAQTAYDGYNHGNATVLMGVDPGTLDSHKEWTEEMGHKTTTASKFTVTDHFTPPNKPWGLTGFRKFRQMGAESSARVVESETPKQALIWATHHHAPYCI